MRIFELKLKSTKFINIKTVNKMTSCSICFEEFLEDTVVRETICKHLFHHACLVEWVKRKIDDKPDCPFCRTDLQI